MKSGLNNMRETEFRVWDNTLKCYLVKDNSGGFTVGEHNMMLSWYANHYGCEIIGNIHERSKIYGISRNS